MQEEEILMTPEEEEQEINLEQENQEQDIGLENENITLVGGSTDYEDLINKPQINSVELIGNKTSEELNLQRKGNYANSRITNIEIDNLFS